MKTTKRKVITLFVLLFLGFTMTMPVYSAESAGDNSQEESSTTTENISQEDFIKSLQPKNTGEVTIKVDKKKRKKVVQYNLSKNNTQTVINKDEYILPVWMNNESCINNKKNTGSVFFGNDNVNCNNFIIEGESMNNFSKVFFSTIIEKKRKSLANSEEENSSNSNQGVLADTQNEQSFIDVLEETLGNGVIANSGERKSTIVQEELLTLSSSESEEKLGDENDGKLQDNNNQTIVVGDISSGDKLNNSVDRILDKFLDPDMYFISDKETKIIEKEVIEVDIYQEKLPIVELSFEDLFPAVSVHSDVSNFSKKLFGPNTKNILFGAKIDSATLSGISSNYLAIALEKFRSQKEIIEVGSIKMFGLSQNDYYNKAIIDLYNKFLDKKPSILEKKQIAKDISAISFSFATYANSTINYKTKDVFKNKLILDFQKLEKDYKNVSKQNIIKNFLLRR